MYRLPMTVSSRRYCTVLPLVACAALSLPANAQWTVTSLQPVGAANSYTFGAFGMQQVGQASVGGTTRASLWSGTAGSWIDLHPQGHYLSSVHAAFGAQQVGYVYDITEHATLWSGTPASLVD